MIYGLVMECYGRVTEPWESGYRIAIPVNPKRTSRTRSGREMRPSEGRSIYKRCTPALAIAFTCRELYPEATRVWYSKTMFLFERAETMESFMRSATAANLSAIRRIKLNVGNHFRGDFKRDLCRMFELIKELSGLRELDLLVGWPRGNPLWYERKAEAATWLETRCSVRKVTLLGCLVSQQRSKMRHGRWCLREATVLTMDGSSGEAREEETYAW